ncbi:MAG: MOSC domain-containing protein [Betaproteobacteria bacterium]
MDPIPRVVAVHRSATHGLSKQAQDRITLLESLGVEGDAHCGRTVQHLYQKRKFPQRSNLRQVHLLQIELLDELRLQGFEVAPGELGENIVTCRLALVSLSRGARLRIGDDAVIEVTGLRTPCVKIDRFRKGVKVPVAQRRPDGVEVLKAAVMGIVVRGGPVRPNDRIIVEPLSGAYAALEPV